MQSNIIVDKNRYFLLDCATKIPIGDLRNGRVKYLRLRSKTLQDMIDLSHGLGTPLNVVEKDRDMSLVRKITPVKDKENEESINGSVYMSYHTENVSHIKPPNFVALFCERKDPNNQGYTLLSDIDDIKELLTEKEKEILSSDKFSVIIEDSLNVDGVDPILPNKVPIFRDGMMFFDNLFMVPDPDAKEVFDKLKEIIKKVEIKILLEPGDILFFNNFKCVHGRSPFTPNYNGLDRCLYRLLILDEYKTFSPFSEFSEYPMKIHNNILETSNILAKKLASESFENTKSQLKKTKRVCIFEVEGGLDKHNPPHRREISLLQNSLKKKGIDCEIVFYKDEDPYIEKYVVDFDYCLVRINPEFYPSYTESRFLNLLKKLEKKIICLPTAKAITTMDSKSIIYHIKSTEFGLSDTELYTSLDDFILRFDPKNARVIKSDHKAEGRGVYLVNKYENTDLLQITEASTNTQQMIDKKSFGEMLFNDNKQILDQRYLPRIKEMEIRIMLIEKKIIWVILFIPSTNEWLANGDGIYFSPKNWPNLCNQMEKWLPKLESFLKRNECKLPFLWSADFILDGEMTGFNLNMRNIVEYADRGPFVLSEINCSCLGFRQNQTQPDVSIDIAKAISNYDLGQ